MTTPAGQSSLQDSYDDSFVVSNLAQFVADNSFRWDTRYEFVKAKEATYVTVTAPTGDANATTQATANPEPAQGA